MKVRLNKEQPTSAQRKAIKAECEKEFLKLLGRFNHQVAAQILYILRFDYGFGQERLQKFVRKLKNAQIDLEDKYEMGGDCTWWLCEQKLKESGINVEEILE